MKSFNCNECIHMNVCPAYMVTIPECDDFLPIGNVIPVVRCRDCKWYMNGIIFKDMKFCCRMRGHDGKKARYIWPEDGFCSYGERKTDGEVTKVL